MRNTQETDYLTSFVYKIYIEWFKEEKGGRKHIPKDGSYFCTTDLIHYDDIVTWSIGINLDHQLMWFLFDDIERQIEVGQVIDLMEGSKTVGQAMIYQIKKMDTLHFWYEICPECDGSGRLQLCIEERYFRPILCCDECYFSYFIPIQNNQIELINVLKVKNHLACLPELNRYNIMHFAKYIC